MKHIGLFEGIGGFSLAARWMGWETIAWCEWNEFGQKVLKHHFPKATPHGDITKTDFTIYNGQCDILTGGFPCQPYSSAGKRLGKEDERHLWPEMRRAIQEIEPTYIVGENVRGLLNWNGGLVFDEVCTDLENLGYQIAPCLIPAVGVNAPHKRERIWFVAHANGTTKKYNERTNFRTQKEVWGANTGYVFGKLSCNGNVADTEHNGLEHSFDGQPKGNLFEQQEGEGANCNPKCANSIETIGGGWIATDTDSGRQSCEKHREAKSGRVAEKSVSGYWDNFPTQSPICSRNDGLSPRLDGITFSKWRNESIKAGGNAIVPQIAYQIFKAIELCNSDHIK
jgi:DNA (cytosine-5)-methyltransferase 1